MKGIVIAGTHSGCGKTTVSLGLMAALVRRGVRVAPFKVGPDFIDPGHHCQVAHTLSRNLDGWMLTRAYNLSTFQNAASTADVAVVEGVMGLFDGYDGNSEAGSTAQMAKWLGLPVVLVVDARSMARSAAALVMGFENFDPQLRFAGVFFNNLGSRRHQAMLKEALPGTVRMPCLGGLLREEAVRIPERHLGLVTREDHPLDDRQVQRLADRIEESLDIAALIAGLPEAAWAPASSGRPPAVAAGREKIGVARDSAFCFYYPDNLEFLEKHGAQVIFFSPLHDDDLPPGLDGLYFGGGYPELFAERLANNQRMLSRIREQSAAGMPIYAECGGFMLLCADLQDLHGRSYPMAGCFALATRMLPRLKALGYREVELSRETIIGGQGLSIRGHEFHYSELADPPSPPTTAYRIADRAGMERPAEGYLVRRTLGSYIHLHFGSAPRAAQSFVDSCRAFRAERTNLS
jgi:cobyrinic acid a,c-diamide synthase